MLRNPLQITSVTVEDRDAGSFDDVVVRRRRGSDVYIQAKTAMRGSTAVHGDWLLAAQTPNGKSPLEQYYNTYLKLQDGGRPFVLEFWTTRSFDANNPLLGGLRDSRIPESTPAP